MNKINLSPYKKRNKLYFENLTRLLRVGSIISVTVIIGLASTFFVLNNTSDLPVLKQQEATVLTNLSFLQTRAIKIYLIRDRTKLIENLLAKRTIYESLLFSVSREKGSDVIIDSLSVKNKNLLLTVSSRSLLSLNTFLDRFTQSAKENNITKLSVNDVGNTSTTGKFTLTIAATIL